jgi:hypothetical protein
VVISSVDYGLTTRLIPFSDVLSIWARPSAFGLLVVSKSSSARRNCSKGHFSAASVPKDPEVHKPPEFAYLCPGTVYSILKAAPTPTGNFASLI